MKSIIARLAGLLFAAALALVACEEATTTTPAVLCTPSIAGITPVNPPLTNAGGAVQLTGRNFWRNFSSTTLPDTTPEPGASPTTPTATPVPYPSKYDVVVRFGTQDALVTEAYEQSIPLDPSVAPRDLDGNPVASNCETCTSCLDTNASNGLGCGGCDAECMGCQQVIVTNAPAVPLTDGTLSEDGSTLRVPVTVISGINYSAPVYYDFAVNP